MQDLNSRIQHRKQRAQNTLLLKQYRDVCRRLESNQHRPATHSHHNEEGYHDLNSCSPLGFAVFLHGLSDANTTGQTAWRIYDLLGSPFHKRGRWIITFAIMIVIMIIITIITIVMWMVMRGRVTLKLPKSHMLSRKQYTECVPEIPGDRIIT